MKYAIVKLSVKPRKSVFDFLITLKRANYDIFVCVDDNSYILPDFDSSIINIIKYENDEAYNNGFSYTENIGATKSVLRTSARDKALYYFANINKNYDFVWMIEADVYVSTNKILESIDEKYTNGDLLLGKYNKTDIYNDPCFNWYDLVKDHIHYPLPWAWSWISITRVSKLFLEKISNHAQKYNRLYMDEILFPTIAIHNNLKIIETD